MNLTAVVTCKDRDNINYCIASMRACYPRPYCIVVDFGSKIPIDFSEQRSWLKVIHVTRDTDLFHKARAINIGIRNVQTKFLCIVDADQIFQPNFFGVVKNALQEDASSFVMCKTYSLTKLPLFQPFDYKGVLFSSLLAEAKTSGVPLHGDGCCNGLSTKFAVKIQGYDETYVGYRAQDSDFALRAISGGLHKVWIDSFTSMVHLPHLRVGEYYSDKYKVTNKAKYKKKTKWDSKKVVIANKNTAWGML